MRNDKELGLEDRGFDDRWYDIRYRSVDETLSGQVRIYCGGRPRARYCSPGPFPKFAGLVIQYHLSQWRLPAPDAVSTDPTTEPGAILQFDQRFREWLVSVERPR
jgi:hypothetical protein